MNIKSLDISIQQLIENQEFQDSSSLKEHKKGLEVELKKFKFRWKRENLKKSYRKFRVWKRKDFKKSKFNRK